ncbi:enoyl-CoA hydratase/isomerase family protein [Nocardioides acrostichi]|uniref:Enoyl-CoA hydratase/isomerase family protein n=1 Tax=Nocardioides acrostichi TaxID=2784339 RepID=A0A930UTZ8_9ACTN|nr:enoyl-CoA hydratase/isomerase family protein [Nocardioides acrostichi]MBF4160803.1 enoyl-CoA hydratase/isomerase family protein [Nocardioides acrostichi]
MSDDGARAPVSLIVTDGVATLLLDRPEKSHAWLGSMYRTAATEIEALAGRVDVDVLIVDSTGDTVFSGGGDLAELAALRDAGDRRAVTALLHDFERLLRSIQDLPQVTIAAITGSALGAGLEIACACDLRVASRTATLGIPAARIGVVIARPDVARLVRVAGPALATEMLLCARILTAQEALEHGLVSRVVDPGKVRSVVGAMATEVTGFASDAVRAMKQHLAAVCTRWDEMGAELEPSADALLSQELGQRVARHLRGLSRRDAAAEDTTPDPGVPT